MVEKWIIACGRRPADFVKHPATNENFRVCHRHFGPEDYEAFFMNTVLPPHQQRWLLKPDAVPNRNLSGDPAIERRRERTRQRLQRKEQKEIVRGLLGEEEAKASKTIPGYRAMCIQDPSTNKPVVTFVRNVEPLAHAQDSLPTSLPSTGMPPVILPTQPVPASFVKPNTKLGNITDMGLKLDAATDRIVELEEEVRLLKAQRELYFNKVNDLQMALNSMKKSRANAQATLRVAKYRWNKREKKMIVTDRKKLAYAKEYMFKHTCWSRQMIDMFLDNNKTRTSWSSADLQLGLSIYSLSPRAYRFLVNFNLLPLPAKSSLKKARFFKRVGTETGIKLYEQTEPEQQQTAQEVEQGNDSGSDDEDEENERRMNEEMEVADQESSSESEDEEEDNSDNDDVKMLGTLGNADKSILDKIDPQQDSVADPDFLNSLMEEVVLPEHGRSMPNL